MPPTDVLPGSRNTFDSTAGYLIPVEDSLGVLKDRANFMMLLNKFGIGSPVNSYKLTWFEKNRTLSKEDVTFADGSGTTVTVIDTAAYKVGDILAIEAERLVVVSRASTTVLNVTRAYQGTTGAAHAAKTMYNLGLSETDGADAPEARSGIPSPTFNYVEWFAESAELTWQQIAEAQAGGNPMTEEIADTTYVFWRRLFQAVLLGKRYEDVSGKKRQFGGLEQFILTNPTVASAAVSKALINAELLQIMESDQGGNVNDGDLIILTSMYQAQKIDDLDSSIVRTSYDTKETGSNDIQFYKPGMGLAKIPIITDVAVPRDRLYILNTAEMSLRPQVNNGVSGRAALYEAKTPGKAHEKKVIRGGYTFQLKKEKTHTYLSALT